MTKPITASLASAALVFALGIGAAAADSMKKGDSMSMEKDSMKGSMSDTMKGQGKEMADEMKDDMTTGTDKAMDQGMKKGMEKMDGGMGK